MNLGDRRGVFCYFVRPLKRYPYRLAILNRMRHWKTFRLSPRVRPPVSAAFSHHARSLKGWRWASRHHAFNGFCQFAVLDKPFWNTFEMITRDQQVERKAAFRDNDSDLKRNKEQAHTSLDIGVGDDDGSVLQHMQAIGLRFDFGLKNSKRDDIQDKKDQRTRNEEGIPIRRVSPELIRCPRNVENCEEVKPESIRKNFHSSAPYSLQTGNTPRGVGGFIIGAGDAADGAGQGLSAGSVPLLSASRARCNS
jgi:hypothetical protein